jgi:hypothetical protein
LSYEKTPDGGHAENMDETHSQPRFIAWLAMVLGGLALLFALFVLLAMTHGS